MYCQSAQGVVMPKARQRGKRPADVIGAVVKVMRIDTGEQIACSEDEGKDSGRVAGPARRAYRSKVHDKPLKQHMNIEYA